MGVAIAIVGPVQARGLELLEHAVARRGSCEEASARRHLFGSGRRSTRASARRAARAEQPTENTLRDDSARLKYLMESMVVKYITARYMIAGEIKPCVTSTRTHRLRSAGPSPHNAGERAA